VTWFQDCFEGVIGADTMGDACKPEEAAFHKALRYIGARPAATAMFEDSVKNLRTAKALGMTTLLVAGPTALEEGARAPRDLQHCDAVVSRLCEEEVRKALPRLWAT
jgi:putative hydrolase of the HAD superfamily